MSILFNYFYVCTAGTKAVIRNTTQNRKRRLCVTEHFKYCLLMCGTTPSRSLANIALSIKVFIHAREIQASGAFPVTMGYGYFVGTQLTADIDRLSITRKTEPQFERCRVHQLLSSLAGDRYDPK